MNDDEIMRIVQSEPCPEVDGTAALRLLREIVGENPDFVYQTPDDGSVCRYEQDGYPSCLIGQALARAGYTVQQLKAMDGAPDASSAMNLAVFGFNVTPDAREVFGAAQRVQDACVRPWSDALVRAESRAAGLGVKAL